MLELDVIGDRLIGSDEDGGLSLEQRKRTTLGVELAANPSLIFLGAHTPYHMYRPQLKTRRTGANEQAIVVPRVFGRSWLTLERMIC